MILAALKAIGSFIRAIPWWIWTLVLFGVLFYSYGEYKENVGERTVQTAWNASRAKGEAIVKELKEKRNTVTTITETKIVEKVKYIEGKARVIEKVREVFVPTDSGMLSGGFRLYYDAAITNTIPDPSQIATAAPVAITDVADTHAYNAEQCNKAYARVEGWELWAKEQCKLNEKGCDGWELQ